MTFSEIQTEILDRLNYTSSTAIARVGRLINKIYKQVGTEIGINFARRVASSAAVTINNAAVTFTGIEHIERIWYEDSSGHPHMLRSVLIDELRNEASVSNDQPSVWALYSTTSNSVTVRLDAKPATAYTLNVEGITEVADLSGSSEPAFSESFHDIIIEGVLREEYTKLEKPNLADRAEAAYEKRLSGLRMFQATNGYIDIYQGKQQDGSIRRGSGGGSSSASLGTTALTITALWTFDRDTGAPFAVTDTSAYVANLFAEGVGNLATDKLVGRDTAGTGESEAIGLDTTLEFTGSQVIRRAALTGDVTASAGSNATAIANNAVLTAMILNDNVTFAKIQNVGANAFLGRAASSSGDVSEVTIGASQLAGRGDSGNLTAITVGTGLSMTGTTLISTSSAGDDAQIIIPVQVFS